ncbi:two-component system response regulator YesN [Paenibacillus cellulosilyticus]|uniref:Two-component system response regulator YesN n=1 Tax=Paenibacillus cellulosilyticus TaxID=375489 RepID=A0A2V2Z268_9BACL|nr:helix-turn-helix domain-containing protein [Paenibacillus cellulosilyticus]PWW07225.1 two-component system response regulator YesN [Paenibacillus cellulosilyticus]QKS44582.1 helix-turn-helix domain-containing protein [Paenibacillus cellulosilyticus]
MYRLLIVDDEEIITNGLYEVFNRFMPERLDVYKAYSAKEALEWMSRTRIDIVMTDIAMPGMSGLELSEEILKYWPRCRVIFLTGHSEFEYAYRAIQLANVRYLLKTEGYAKVAETVKEVLDELVRGNLENQLLEQSREQLQAYQLMAQGDYMRHLLHDSDTACERTGIMVDEFRKLGITLDSTKETVMVLGRLSYPEGKTYLEKNEMMNAAQMLAETYLTEKTRSISIVDKQGDLVWFIQPFLCAEDTFDVHLLTYLEGMLELIQEACIASLRLTIGFTFSGTSCVWREVTQQYERLRQLQQLRVGDSAAIIVRDHPESSSGVSAKEGFISAAKAEMLAAHLEAGRSEAFMRELEDISGAALQCCGKFQYMIEAYYTIALMLYASIGRLGLHGRIDEHGKLMRLEEHASMKEGFCYLKGTAEAVFQFKQSDERDRTSLITDRICQYIEDHLSEDLSLVRLAEIHYFNPSYLSRFFKQESGTNLSDFIDRCRVKKAKELLRDPNMKVRDVAVEVGYEAAHSFTRFFKKVTGMTPQEYRDTLTVA